MNSLVSVSRGTAPTGPAGPGPSGPFRGLGGRREPPEGHRVKEAVCLGVYGLGGVIAEPAGALGGAPYPEVLFANWGLWHPAPPSIPEGPRQEEWGGCHLPQFQGIPMGTGWDVRL